MEKITHISGLTIPLNMRDVDTDLIIPAQYLTTIKKEGYGEALFRRLKDNDPNFVFNQASFQSALILVTRENFGCGSSREHAVWALKEAGIKAVIATSFSDIFFSNSAKNGLVLITLPNEIIQNMLKQSEKGNYILTIDIENQLMTSSLQEKFNFAIEPFQKYCFMQGLDELDYILSHMKEIKAFAKKQTQQNYSTAFNSFKKKKQSRPLSI